MNENKRGFFSRNKGKIGKYGTIAINIMFLVGISVSVIMTKGTAAIFVPQTAAFLCPSFFSLFFAFIISVAPSKVEECKNLFLQSVKDEDDRATIEKAFSDVMTEYENARNTERSNEPSVQPSIQTVVSVPQMPQVQVETREINVSPDNSPHEEVVRMNAYYHPSTNKLDITPRQVPSTRSSVPPLYGVGRRNQ